jgi:hypothetical protein
MKLYKLINIAAVVLLLAFTLYSCEDMLEAKDENNIEADDNYRTENDADNAILGIYSKFMTLVDRVIVLEELRADLLDITEKSTTDLQAINNHTATATNKWCEIAPFYEVILNCNDALYNFDKMLADNRLSKADYGHRYADVMTIRCWVYLELAIHFGNIPYVTDPLLTVEDVKNQANFPEISFDEVVSKLTASMVGLPTLDLSTDSPLYSATADGYLMRMFFLNKKLMLGDLYLWADKYVEAATQYNNFFKEAESKLYPGVEYHAYKADFWVWAGSNEPMFQVCYERYKAADMSTYRNKWKEMFTRSSTNAELRKEMITMVSYDAAFAPEYPLIELFANTGIGQYQMKPSQYAIDDLWETQVQPESGFVFDGRGRESTFDYVNGQPVALKYLYDYYKQSTDNNKTIHLGYNSYSKDQYARNGKWFIYRAALLHLRYAEAANRAGYPDIAYALINNGIKAAYDWPMEDGTTLRSDKEGVQYTGYRPADDNSKSVPYGEPFYLDARQNDLPYTYYRSPWCRSSGIRYRAWVDNIEKPDWVQNKSDSIRWMEEAIVTEDALECGHEGHRWGTLLRIAMRKNKDNGSGTAFLNESLGNKFKKSGGSAPNLTPATWFLPKNR